MGRGQLGSPHQGRPVGRQCRDPLADLRPQSGVVPLRPGIGPGPSLLIAGADLCGALPPVAPVVVEAHPPSAISNEWPEPEILA